MATKTISRTSAVMLALDGGSLPQPVRQLQLPPLSIDTGSAEATGPAVLRLGPMSALFDPLQAPELLQWAQALAAGQATPRHGAVTLADPDGHVRRQVQWRDGQPVQLAWATLDASASKQPFGATLAWQVSDSRDAKADGSAIRPTPVKPTQRLLCSNFRVDGLPFDSQGVLRLQLPSVQAESKLPGGRARQPRWHLTTGPVQLTLRGRGLAEALDWVQQQAEQVRNTGRPDPSSALNLVVELLDPTLKRVLLRWQLQGCHLLSCDEPALLAGADALPELVLALSVNRVELKPV